MLDKYKRLVIYFFYDKDGVADRYIEFFLEGLKPVTSKYVIVCNGKLTKESQNLFKKYSEDIIVRDNKGFDVWAYKTALEYVGWDELRKYYEVCLINFTIMGPVHPFEEMFSKMDKEKELDFWGVTMHLGWPSDPWGTSPYGYLPKHLQSHFHVYRNRFLKSAELKQYWDNVPAIKNYYDAVGKHETYFTKYFADKGFRWKSYIDNKDEEDFNVYPLIFNAVKLIKIDNCPVFKRKSFFYDKSMLLEDSFGEAPIELFRYLQNNTDYDVDLIMENIIRTCNQSDFVNALGLYYVLSTGAQSEKPVNGRECALIMHLYYEDLIIESMEYAKSMPEESDIYITTSKESMIPEIKEVFSRLPNKVEIRKIENRGRDVSSLLVGCADIIDRYKYICFFHDKKTIYVKPWSVGSGFAYKVSKSVLYNKYYVKNIINLFEDNSRLGLLMGRQPDHGVYSFVSFGKEWGPNFLVTKQLAERININVDMDKNKAPIAPYGTVFWFRTKAMKKLFLKKWKYEDFPIEPNNIDGTILHAVERIYPFVVQDAGYYPAYVMPSEIASLEISNLVHYRRIGLFVGMETIARYMPKNIYERFKIIMKGLLPNSLYFGISGFKHKVFKEKSDLETERKLNRYKQ